MRSAALRKTAARSANGIDSHAGFADRADSTALETSAELALVYFATISLWAAGFGCVKGGVSQSCEGNQLIAFCISMLLTTAKSIGCSSFCLYVSFQLEGSYLFTINDCGHLERPLLGFVKGCFQSFPIWRTFCVIFL